MLYIIKGKIKHDINMNIRMWLSEINIGTKFVEFFHTLYSIYR